MMLLLFVIMFASACTLLEPRDYTATKLQPNVSISYDASQQRFFFEAQTFFVRQETIWVLDFAPFAAKQLFEPNNCQNREYAQAPTLADYFASANHSQVRDALGTNIYLGYGPSNFWQLTAPSCDRVKYARSFSFGELLVCKNNDKTAQITFQSVPLTNLLLYSGTFYVSAVKPVWKNESKTEIVSYQVFEYEYPFMFKFGSSVQNVRVFSSGSEFVMSVLQIKLNEDAKFQAIVRTEMGLEQYLAGVQLEATPFDASVQVILSNQQCISKCYQEWLIVSKEARLSYRGNFELSWHVCSPECSPWQKVYGQFTVQMDVVETIVGQYSMNTKTRVYRNWTEETVGPFRAGDVITMVTSLATRDLNAFYLELKNAWICYSNDPYSIKWSPENGQYGCAQTDQMVTLIKNGIATNANAIELSFGTKLYPAHSLPILPSNSMFGLSFLAQALSHQDALYFVHLECQIVPATNGTALRATKLLEKPQHFISPLFINAPNTTDAATISLTATFLTFGMIIGSAMILCMGAIVCYSAAICLCVAHRET